MPTPKKSEQRKEFMARCIPQIIDEDEAPDQAVSICSSIWKNRAKSFIDLVYLLKSQHNFKLRNDD